MICYSSSLSLSLLPGKLPPLSLQEAHTRLQPGRGWSPDDHDHDYTDVDHFANDHAGNPEMDQDHAAVVQIMGPWL